MKTTLLIQIPIFLVLYSSCNSATETSPAGGPSAPSISTENYRLRKIDLRSDDPSVCDPLDPSAPNSDTQGIAAHLSYYPDMGVDSQNRDNRLQFKVADYLGLGNSTAPVQVGGVQIFLSDINVPTRSFDSGFTTNDGRTLVKPNSDVLLEYFGLNLEASIVLSPSDAPGKKQFAILSDDGAIFEIGDGSGGYSTLIDNDGNHPTRLKVASQAIDFTSSTKLPMKLGYYQGPRYHIALVLLWRDVTDDQACTLNEPLNLGTDKTRWFTTNSDGTLADSAWYKDLQTRGWKPLTAQNFVTPDSVRNTCSPTFPISGRACFVEHYTNYAYRDLALAKSPIDEATLEVFVNSNKQTSSDFNYNAATNNLKLNDYNQNQIISDFEVHYCQPSDIDPTNVIGI